ncbi:hypothetical protein MMC28_008066 [Mycoblastus sanguinarius]|nr:hypothetical protein [Mycoblastus sanguinarius]
MAEQALKPELKEYHGSNFQLSLQSVHILRQAPSVDERDRLQLFHLLQVILIQNGYLYTSPSSNELFVVEKGEGTLKGYTFADKTIAHKFCPQCGVSVFGVRDREGPNIVINVRALEDVDFDQLEITSYDGATLEPAYNPPNGPRSILGSDHATTQIYGASCHCGKVTFEVTSKPLQDIEVTQCNCSICSRKISRSQNAYLWFYPPQSAVTIHGTEHLTRYYFGYKVAGHSFCSHCGVSLINQIQHPVGLQPVNVRAFNGVDLRGLKLKKVDGRNASLEHLKPE